MTSTPTSKPDIAVVCPTRGRLDDAVGLLNSLKRTSTHADLLFYVDEDERDYYWPLMERGDACFHVGPQVGPCESANMLVTQFPGYAIYGVAPDDSRFETKGWDDYTTQTFESFPGRLGVLSPAHPYGEFVNFPYVSREWIDLLGWFAYPEAFHFIWDTVLEMLGDATRIVYAPPEKFFMSNEARTPTNYEKHFQADCEKFLWFSVLHRRPLVEKIRAAIKQVEAA